MVRLWMEGNDRTGLRARITETLDSPGSAGSAQAMATAGDPEDVYAIVRTWVEAFIAQETQAHPVTLA